MNGHAQLRIGGANKDLLAEVRPYDEDGKPRGGPPLWIACDGTPTVATGLPPEVVPGIARGRDGVESRSEALRLIGERLQELESEGVAGATELRKQLADQSGKPNSPTSALLTTLESSPLREALSGERMGNCFTTLKATHEWETARKAAPGRALMGDEVAENGFTPGDAEHWIVAGSGGTGVANAEIILKKDPRAKVTIIGSAPPPALTHQVQYRQMLEDFTKGTDPRLRFVEARVGAIKTVQDENGRTSFEVPYDVNGTTGEKEGRVLRGDGYVANLGRTNPIPPALQRMADEVRADRGEITGDLMFDKDDQYIGYGLTFRTEDGREHRVDVDGAASWQLPREIFTRPGIQGELNDMGARALPAETGNASPGFSPIARQSALKARAVAAAQAGDEKAVKRLQDIPDRWKRPGPAAEAESPTTPAPPSPGSAPTLAPTLAPTTPQREAAPEIPKQSAPTAPARQPAPAPEQAPVPKPAPGRGAPDAHLWQMGVPQTRKIRTPAPTQQLPPDQQRPGPARGPGLGD
ncbi:hypothetical protein Q5762_08595 [Streptomyces sp. P9(2023)]|uniref:hypothetical protein n=1 Tax=Streptomyces sp. P9(2023) TaxID=3064394 RepID=UPI0028F439C0|nr:hypothetical protein [Streptomyces sp. P9(2023)]MDT9688414.1 hypothetical protein [Streptomyces sp. P9(2023)]